MNAILTAQLRSEREKVAAQLEMLDRLIAIYEPRVEATPGTRPSESMLPADPKRGIVKSVSVEAPKPKSTGKQRKWNGGLSKSPEPNKPTIAAELRGKIVEALKDGPDEGLGFGELRKMISALGVSFPLAKLESNLGPTITDMKVKGIVRKNGDLWQLVRPGK